MLGKLIKHEWKGIYKVGCILTLVMIAVTAIGCIMLQLPAMTALFSEKNHLSSMQMLGWSMMGVMSLLIYIFLLMGATYGLFIFLGIRFYRTMYTDQGYLTNTLPVTANQLLVSKIVVSAIWYLLIEIVVFASVFALILAMLNGLLSETLASEGYRNIWDAFAGMISEVSSVYDEIGFDLVHYGITMILLVLVGPFTGMTILYGSITMGQLSKRHKGVMGIIAYLGVNFLTMIISSVVQMINTFRYSHAIMQNEYGSMTVNMNLNGTYDANLIVTIVFAVVLYFVAHYILTKKLNMD